MGSSMLIARTGARTASLRIGLGVAALLLLTASSGDGAEPRWTTVRIASERGLDVINCVELGDSDRGGAYRGVSPDFHVAHGHSGSPVFDGSGTLAGGVSAYLVAGGPGFRTERIDSIRAARRRVAVGSGPRVASLPSIAIAAAPEPGQAVWWLSVWGDVNRGTTGAITEIDGEWIELFAHAPNGLVGEAEARIVSARCLGLRALPNGEFESELVPQATIGAGIASTRATAVGVLGREPSAARISIAWSDWPDWNRSFSLSRRWSLSRDAAFGAILEVLGPLDSVPMVRISESVRATVDTAGERSPELRPTDAASDSPSGAARLASPILEALDALVRAGDVPSEIRISVATGINPR